MEAPVSLQCEEFISGEGPNPTRIELTFLIYWTRGKLLWI